MAKEKAKPSKSTKDFSKQLESFYTDQLVSVEKHYRLTTTVPPAARLSSGSLVFDQIMAGGFYPGRWYTVFGKEASGKSTLAMTALESLIWQNIPYRLMFDFEGSFDMSYFRQMCRKPITEKMLMGEKDDKGRLLSRGLISYYSEDVAETFFDSMASLLRKMPNKMWVPERKGWYLSFERTKHKEAVAAFKSQEDKHLSDREFMWIPSPDSLPQAMIILDSYPAMLPENLDEDDKKASMASQAVMFSANIKKIKGKFRKKNVLLVGVNQLRTKPGFTMGNPEYEPGGDALRFYSDGRIRVNAVGIPKDAVGQGAIAQETSVLGKGMDQYRYANCKMIKNKMGPNFMEGNFRIWMSDPVGHGHGICPVYDFWKFGKMTGTISGSMKKFELNMPGVVDKPLKMEWRNLKELILCKGDELRDAHKSLKLKKPLNLRKGAFAFIRGGDALKAYFDAQNGDDDDGE